jgi:ankyrin repeat protein
MIRSLIFLIIAAFAAAGIALGQDTDTSERERIMAQRAAQSASEDAFVETVKQGDLQKIAEFLAAGASPNARSKKGGLALCWSIRSNRIDIVKLLLEAGADVNAEEGLNGPPLLVAALMGHADMTRLLLARGADPNAVDDGGHAALFSAAIGAMFKSTPPEFAMALRDEEFREEGQTPERMLKLLGDGHHRIVQELLDAGADVNAQASDCHLSALMVAAMGGEVEIAKTLLAHGADVNLKSGKESALKMATYTEKDLEKEANNPDAEPTSDREKQAFIGWLNATAARRSEIANLLIQAGALE